MIISRRFTIALLPLALARPAAAQHALSFVTAGPGSVFLPYGQGVARI